MAPVLLWLPAAGVRASRGRGDVTNSPGFPTVREWCLGGSRPRFRTVLICLYFQTNHSRDCFLLNCATEDTEYAEHARMPYKISRANAETRKDTQQDATRRVFLKENRSAFLGSENANGSLHSKTLDGSLH